MEQPTIAMILVPLALALMVWYSTKEDAPDKPPARDRSSNKCGPDNQRGHHGEVLTGLGGMGDAELCLRCGKEYYPTFSKSMDSESRRPATTGDWGAIETARNLPMGINRK